MPQDFCVVQKAERENNITSIFLMMKVDHIKHSLNSVCFSYSVWTRGNHQLKIRNYKVFNFNIWWWINSSAHWSLAEEHTAFALCIHSANALPPRAFNLAECRGKELLDTLLASCGTDGFPLDCCGLAKTRSLKLLTHLYESWRA